jgi:uncharacterized membrane protein
MVCMSFSDSAAGVPTPPTREFTAAWVAYALFAIGALFWWPALLGLIVAYSKRPSPTAGFIETHHRWLIRTFWLSLAGGALFIGVMVAGLWPVASDLVRAVLAEGGDWGAARREFNLKFDFSWAHLSITLAALLAGGFGLFVVWVWYVYRIVRGMLRLHEAQPVP